MKCLHPLAIEEIGPINFLYILKPKALVGTLKKGLRTLFGRLSFSSGGSVARRLRPPHESVGGYFSK